MDTLISAWLMYFASYFLAALACAVLVRRGLLPLHISAVAGAGAYVFAAVCGVGLDPVLAFLIGLCGAVVFASVTGLFFIRVSGAGASLGAMAIQLLFDQYVRSVGGLDVH
jgi:hypothetical protein